MYSFLLKTPEVCMHRGWGRSGGEGEWGQRLRHNALWVDSSSTGPQQMCPVMSWLLCLCLWVSVTAIQLCQATFYDTIQQHPGTRPGRTTIHMIGESFCTFFLIWHDTYSIEMAAKNTFWIISIYFHCLLSTATVCWVWLLKCLIRFLRENISPLYLSLYFINILVINKLFSRQIAQGLTFIKICTT